MFAIVNTKEEGRGHPLEDMSQKEQDDVMKFLTNGMYGGLFALFEGEKEDTLPRELMNMTAKVYEAALNSAGINGDDTPTEHKNKKSKEKKFKDIFN